MEDLSLEFIEMKRANVRNYASVRRVFELKRMRFNRRELRLRSNANAKLRLRLVVISSLVPVLEELKAM